MVVQFPEVVETTKEPAIPLNRQREVPNNIDSRLPSLILPSATIPYIKTARHCFSALAKTQKFFVKGGAVVEIHYFKGLTRLIELDPTAFQSRLEEYFNLQRWVVLTNGDNALKLSRCSLETAKVLLKTNEAAQLLPHIDLVTSSPLFVERDGEIIALNKGYHEELGGTFITKNHKISTNIELAEAVQTILSLLDEFLFVAPSDKSRAVAAILSPALRLGGLLACDFPVDIAEAEESQSGKTYRQHCITRIYGEEPQTVNKKNPHEGGVGSLEENISAAFLCGKPFLMLENIRGHVDSPIFESALRGTGTVQVRKPYSQPQDVGTDRVLWFLSSNKAEVTRDLANRAVVTRIKKQPSGFRYKQFPEGDLKAHISKNSDHYLSCILSVVRYWHSHGKPRTTDNRHDFREWCQALDWIVQTIFKLPPLLDGHRAEQDRISNPDLNWLRDVAFHVKKDERLNEKLRPSEIADLCEQHGVEIPGCRDGLSPDQISMRVGKILKRLFRDSTSQLVGDISVERSSTQEYNQDRQEFRPVNFYGFTESADEITSVSFQAS